MQTIYFHICLGPYRGFGSKQRQYALSGYHLDTISYSSVAIMFFIVKWGWCTERLLLKNWYHNLTVHVRRAKKYCGRVVLTISDIKPFLVGKFAESIFKKLAP